MSHKDFIMWFSNETGEDLSEEQQKILVDKLRDLSKDFGLDISQWGNPKAIRKMIKTLETTGYFDEPIPAGEDIKEGDPLVLIGGKYYKAD